MSERYFSSPQAFGNEDYEIGLINQLSNIKQYGLPLFQNNIKNIIDLYRPNDKNCFHKKFLRRALKKQTLKC